MLTGSIVLALSILFFIFFIIYKRDMLTKMFSLNASQPAGELQEQLERTADTVIKRLETQIAHLELLLDEADAKITQLDQKLQAADNIIRHYERLSPIAKQTSVDFRLPPESPSDQTTSGSFTVAAPDRDNSGCDEQSARDGKDSLTWDKRKQIIEMSQQGYSVMEIAKTTGMGKGEIMLFLQLNKK